MEERKEVSSLTHEEENIYWNTDELARVITISIACYYLLLWGYWGNVTLLC
jgi:hypothetical protein